MTRQFTVQHLTDRHGRPYAHIAEGFPGLGADMTPDELEHMARQLRRIAIDCRRAAQEKR